MLAEIAEKLQADLKMACPWALMYGQQGRGFGIESEVMEKRCWNLHC